MESMGEKILLITTPVIFDLLRETVEKACCNTPMHYEPFGGECSKKEIARLDKVLRAHSCDIVVGLGGGKTLDTAKALAVNAKCPMVSVPTTAATDAPTSALSVIYTETGEFEEYLFLPVNPSLVLVDTAIIAKAPVRFLVAGMGDALATKIEARACVAAHGNNFVGAKATKAAIAICNTCYDILMEDGLKAMEACKAQVVTQAFENVVEANTLLSGLGFESTGIAAAHAVHNALTVLPETHHYYHGEKVAFGVLVQLVLENAPTCEFAEVLNFCKTVGLPTCLRDLGVTTIDHAQIMQVAKLACAEGDTMGNMPFDVSPDDVYAAILTADRLGG